MTSSRTSSLILAACLAPLAVLSLLAIADWVRSSESAVVDESWHAAADRVAKGKRDIATRAEKADLAVRQLVALQPGADFAATTDAATELGEPAKQLAFVLAVAPKLRGVAAAVAGSPEAITPQTSGALRGDLAAGAKLPNAKAKAFAALADDYVRTTETTIAASAKRNEFGRRIDSLLASLEGQLPDDAKGCLDTLNDNEKTLGDLRDLRRKERTNLRRRAVFHVACDELNESLKRYATPTAAQTTELLQAIAGFLAKSRPDESGVVWTAKETARRARLEQTQQELTLLRDVILAIPNQPDADAVTARLKKVFDGPKLSPVLAARLRASILTWLERNTSAQTVPKSWATSSPQQVACVRSSDRKPTTLVGQFVRKGEQVVYYLWIDGSNDANLEKTVIDDATARAADFRAAAPLKFEPYVAFDWMSRYKRARSAFFDFKDDPTSRWQELQRACDALESESRRFAADNAESIKHYPVAGLTKQYADVAKLCRFVLAPANRNVINAALTETTPAP